MKKVILMILVGGLALAACNTATPAPDTADIPVVTDDFAVSAEGRLVPGNFVQLAFSAGGKVVEVPVAEGAAVAEGEVIARLENSEALMAEVSRAELEVLNAQQVVDDLKENAGLLKAQLESEVAQAQDALDKAQRRLKNLNSPDVEFYQDAVKDAENALLTAQENVTVTDIGSLKAALQAARDGLKFMGDRLGAIRTAIDSCPECDPKRSVTVDGFPQTLDDAQDAYNDALNRVKELEIQLEQAERGNATAVDDAQEALDDAKRDLEWALGGPDSLDLVLAQADVTLADARLADARNRLADVQSGPDPDQLALAEARLATAQSALTAAKVALDNTELRAPFDGTVAKLNLKVGEQVSPGQPVVTLADFSAWVIETDNLTEIEVVKIGEGQGADIVLDALPAVTLRGKVETISGVFEEKRGDITYTVKILLTDQNPQARWGMTAAVTFDK